MAQSETQDYTLDMDYPFSDPITARDSFAATFDLDDPQGAASTYARIMHEHTKRQLQLATRSATRRTSADGSSSATSSKSPASLISQSSVDSNDSAM